MGYSQYVQADHFTIAFSFASLFFLFHFIYGIYGL